MGDRAHAGPAGARAGSYGPGVSAGYSQTRMLLFLAENGPTPDFRTFWRCRAASKTWEGTIRFALAGGWITRESRVLSITDAGREVLARSHADQHDRMRDEFRAPNDRYWLAREAAPRTW